MRFLLDVHVASTIGAALETRGHDVLRASASHADWPDARLLGLAANEARVVVTEDRDFSDLIFRQGVPPPPSILYLRCRPSEQPSMVDRILMVLENVRVEGHMVVIRPTNLRLRPFPERERDNG